MALGKKGVGRGTSWLQLQSPPGPWGVALTPDFFCYILFNCLKKIAISNFVLDKFGEKGARESNYTQISFDVK